MKTRYFVRKLDDGWSDPYYIYNTKDGCINKNIRSGKEYIAARNNISDYEANKSFVEMQEQELALWLSCYEK